MEKLINRIRKNFSRKQIRALFLFTLFISVTGSVFAHFFLFITAPQNKFFFGDFPLKLLRNFILISLVSWIFYFLYSAVNVQSMRLKPVKIFSIIFFSAVSAIIGGSIGLLINRLIMGNVQPATFRYFSTLFPFTLIGAFMLNSYLSLQETIVKLAEKEVNEQKLIQLKTKAELDLLRAKVNPHFLFNTLNSIASLIHSNPQEAEEMVQKLSNLFRYTLDKHQNEFSKLSEEIEIVEAYLSIEKIRFGSRLNYTIDCEHQTRDLLIPVMLIQPLVENSIKRGISKNKGGGNILVHSRMMDENNLLLLISDDGSGFNESDIRFGFGLTSVRARLQLIYDSNFNLFIDSRRGCNINIVLPAKTVN